MYDKNIFLYLLYTDRKYIEGTFDVGIKYELGGEAVGLVRYLQIIYVE